MKTNETMYDLYFCEVNGHIIDVRNIEHISPVNYNKYDENYGFVATLSTQRNRDVFISSKEEEWLEGQRTKLVEHHKHLWMPVELSDEEKDLIEKAAEQKEETDETN